MHLQEMEYVDQVIENIYIIANELLNGLKTLIAVHIDTKN